MYEIIDCGRYSDSTFFWEVKAPDVARNAQPGHFVMLRLQEGGERIPLTVADFNRKAGSITLVIQAVGKTTLEMMQRYDKGDTFADFVGPLGLQSEVKNWGHVVVVGGGLGVAPIFPQLRAFKEAGNRTTAILGFRSKELVFWEERFRPFCDELIICTDDGSYGREGLVTQALESVIHASAKPDRIVAVGPLPMMKACAEVSRPDSVPSVVSLNAIMVDGTGMCGSCRVTINGVIKFACVDGPEFDAHHVNFEELIRRQRRFKKHEAKVNESYEHVCHLEQQLFEEDKRNYKKIRELAPKATRMPERDPDTRANNFDEVNLGYSMAEALTEAERCIQCKNPTCIPGCPVSIDIPRFIRHLLVRDLDTAASVIHESNLFPSICGRVCPQESQCEAQCIIGRKVEPVAIGRLERFIGDHAKPSSPSISHDLEAKIAIVGSGPGGLACAADLAKAGAEVTVYEALHVVGGVLAYGIPAFRLPTEIMTREVASLEKLGVKFETNKVVGKTFTIQQMRQEMGYDAVFIATGAGYPKFLGIAGEAAGGVYSSNEFLTRVNLMGGDQFPFTDTPVNLGQRVVVLGAGNTAMDCLRVARRLGAEHVHCAYRRTEAQAPARIEEIRHAKEEGVQFHWLRSPLEILTDEEDEVTGIRCQVMELGPADDSGRRRPVVVPGEEVTIPCETVIYALGTRANPIIGQSTPGLELNQWGHIVVDQDQATSLEGVFAGGDIVTGGATVILAMGAGRQAAAGITKYLNRPEPNKVTNTDRDGSNLCARCHQPLDGDEDYICCADANLMWHCTQCFKVYEGFALPYGLCAACGGHLEADYRANVPDDATKAAVRAAFEIELGGKAFYEGGTARVQDPALKDVFAKLAKMEAEHIHTLERRYHLTPSRGETPLPTLAQIAVFGETKDDIADSQGLLDLAIRLEERARDFFKQARGRHASDTPAWILYGELAAEEQEHVAILKTERQRLIVRRAGML